MRCTAYALAHISLNKLRYIPSDVRAGAPPQQQIIYETRSVRGYKICATQNDVMIRTIPLLPYIL